MSRIHTPASVEDAPVAAQASLRAVGKQLGLVPNLFRVIANSPAALKGFLGLNAALSAGVLDGATRERIALAVAQRNDCGYCLAAHTYLGRNVAGLSDGEMSANRNGSSTDPKADAAVRFAVAIVEARGHISAAQFEAVRRAGFDDAALMEIVLAVALNTLTNYVNEVAQTEIDFPAVADLAQAA